MIWLIALTVLAFYFAVFYKSQSLSQRSYESGKPPFLFVLLLKVLVRIVCRREGQLYAVGNKGRLQNDGKTRGAEAETEVHHVTPDDDEVVIISNYRVKKESVARYKEVCGEQTDDTVPLCFPESLFMHPLVILICRPSFKISPLGLIHVGQTAKQHEDLQQLLASPLVLEARTMDYRLLPRGIEVDISMRIFTTSERCVWSGVGTFLSRSKQARSSGSAATASRQQTSDVDWKSQDRYSQQQIEVSGNLGLRYAGVTGDWNPHHLYPWSARLMGYRSPIAHGMWTIAKTIALVKASAEDPSRLTEVEGRFKRPLFLPGSAVVEHYKDGSTVKFRVTDPETQAPHLVGSMS